MNARFFLDTNLFVYSLNPSTSEKSHLSTQLIRQAIGTHNGIVSYQVVQEFFSVAFRRFTPPMSVPEAEQYLATVFRPLLCVHSSHALYAEGLHLRSRYRLSWYDSLIVAGAIESGCSVLYSEDMQHGQTFGELRVENPFR
ncbi:MAG: PIN domain-containing protein [Candidatus Korobacteraceae bacterium]